MTSNSEQPHENGTNGAAARGAPVPALDVLVVEDNPVNQKVVWTLLTRWGHRVVLAPDGARGLEELLRRTFDLVLMDVQMPVMDGLAATRAIRARERLEGGHVPIIAITAHALSSDHTRCLEAGMDRYLTKPLNSRLLREMIGDLFAGSAAPAGSAAASMSTGAVNFDLLGEFVGHEPDLIADVIQIFLEDAPEMIEKAARAIAASDARALEMSAHRLKGSLATMGAETAAATASRLEALARADTMAGAGELFEKLRGEVRASSESLASWRDQRAA